MLPVALINRACGGDYLFPPGLGCTPPPAKYFSMRSYIAFRFTPKFWFPAVEPSDPINHLMFNTTAGPGEDPFCKTSLVVTAGDADTVRGNPHQVGTSIFHVPHIVCVTLIHKARAVIEAFTDGGLPSSAVNLDVMPVEKAHYR
jgi:hypothetical protein